MVTTEKGSTRRGNGNTPNVISAAFKTDEALAYLGGISAVTLYRWVERGLLHPNRHSRFLLFSKVELDRFLRQTRDRRWKRRRAA
jgi:Helix-turn-helix domain